MKVSVSGKDCHQKIFIMQVMIIKKNEKVAPNSVYIT